VHQLMQAHLNRDGQIRLRPIGRRSAFEV